VKSEVFNRLSMGYDSLVDERWGTMSSPESECYVRGLSLIYLRSPLPSPVSNSAQVILKIDRG